MSRYLIVNADDFGHSAEVNGGVIEAHERGIVTSASLMVRRPAAAEAASYRGELAVGLHLELGKWIYRRGRWSAKGEIAARDVGDEVRSQLARFRELTGRDPTHLDSHQHVHRKRPVREAALALAEELDVPLREVRGGITYLGGFYGQTDTGEPWPEGVSVDSLLEILRSLGPGTTELGCHPARGVPPGTSYAGERQRELETLCDPRVRKELDELGIELRLFARTS